MPPKYVPIDDSDEEVERWDENKWIRPNSPRLYPTDDVPLVVKQQLNLLLVRPSASDDLIPHDFVPVLALLDPDSGYPAPRGEIAPTPVHFSCSIPDPNPHAIVKALKSRTTMPPRPVIQELEKTLGQAWFNGNKSIVDTHFADYPLPFWVITVWSQLHFVHREQMRWRSVENRIQTARARDPDVHMELRRIADSVMECLRSLEWHAPLAGFSSAGWRGQLECNQLSFNAAIGWTTSFIQFFSDTMLDDEAINMMLGWICLKVLRSDKLGKSVIVQDLHFTDSLLKNYERKSTSPQRRFTKLDDCESDVRNLGRERLYFMLNPGMNHWAVTMVDFSLRTIAYGDSLAGTYRQDKLGLNALAYWLDSAFPSPSGPFKDAPNLVCEQQIDGISCGIAACTLISSQLGLEPPWVAKNAMLSRFTWGLRLMQIHQQASTGSYIPKDGPEDINKPIAEELQATVPQRHAQRANPMDLSTILHNMPADGPVEQVETRSDSPEILDPESPMVPESLESPVCDSPSPLNTNNKYHLDNITYRDNQADHIERDGVLYFYDSSDDEYMPGSGAQPLEIPVSTNNYGKHPRLSSSSESSNHSRAPKRRLITKANASNRKSHALARHSDERHSGPSGISKTARGDRLKKEALLAGTLVTSKVQLQGLLQRARKIDPGAKLVPEDKLGRYIIHSICDTPILLDGALRTSKFDRHHKTCKANKGRRKNAGKEARAAQGCTKINTIFKPVDKSLSLTGTARLSTSGATVLSTPPQPSPKLVQCRGLRPEHHEKVEALVERSQFGGTTSIHKIAEEEYGKPYIKLTASEKNSVRNAVTATAEWVVHLSPTPHVRHSDCQKKCNPNASTVEPADICSACCGLLLSRSFRKAMGRKPVMDPTNHKYVPFVNRNKAQAEMYAKYVGLQEIIKQSDSKSKTPLMVFVRLALSGKLESNQVFLGLLQVISAREDRLARGKGMQGYRNPPGWSDFCNVAYTISPRAYRFLQGAGFPVLGERALRKRRSQTPRFPVQICNQTFERASRFLSTVGYPGPVCISCDDTSLLSKWSPFYDGEANKWFIVGGLGEPIKIDGDVEEIHELIVKETEGKEKATKLRLWCLQPAAPKIPVLILAAMAINSSMKAEQLSLLHNQLIDGLLGAGICVSSYACDGSATERKLVKIFEHSAIATETYSIPHPDPGFPSHDILLHFYGSKLQLISCLQDSKHALKTFRNVLFSGARSLTIGNSVIFYEMVLALSKLPSSPIFQRDVVKVDRQDDRAPIRTFSSAMIALILDIVKRQKPNSDLPLVLRRNLIGLAVYLFVLGDLIDAFQNRCLAHAERCRMVLRAYYFLEIWRSSLLALGYPLATHFISQSAYDIARSLIDGFITLVIVHRDHLEDDHYPLVPWLHSTEPCEHTFGEARKTKPDFTMSDFILMAPKLRVLLDAAVQNGEFESEATANARAAGYYHTEYSSKGIDISALSSFPVDSAVHEANRLGLYDAKALFSLCGIPVTDTLYPPSQLKQPTILPINQWLSDLDDDLGCPEFDDDEAALACTLSDEPSSVANELQAILDAEESRSLGLSHLEDKMESYNLAAVALEFEGQNEIESLPDCDTTSNWLALRHELTQEFPNFPLAPLVLASEIQPGLDPREVDLNTLPTVRAAHETDFAKKAIRIGAVAKERSICTVSDDADIPKNAHSARQKMVKRMHETLRSIEETVSASTGAARGLRYQGQVTVTAAGNAANAAAVATQRSAAAMKTRLSKLKKAKVKCVELIGGAGVSAIAPIRTGAYAIVFAEGKIWLAEVLTFYSKGGGKGGAHGWVESSTTVSNLSYILVQLWEHWNAKEFRSIVKSTASHHAYRFSHLPWQCVLYVTLPSSITQITSERLHINETLYETWSTILKEKEGIAVAVKDMLRRTRDTALDDELSE